MRLYEYLAKFDIKVKEFAEKINYDSVYLSNVSRGSKKPGSKLLKIIQKETNGMVKPKDFLSKMEKAKDKGFRGDDLEIDSAESKEVL